MGSVENMEEEDLEDVESVGEGYGEAYIHLPQFMRCRPGFTCRYHRAVNEVLRQCDNSTVTIHLLLINPYGCDVAVSAFPGYHSPRN